MAQSMGHECAMFCGVRTSVCLCGLFVCAHVHVCVYVCVHDRTQDTLLQSL